MASLIYYGNDSIETIPSTIALTDRSFTISEDWTFSKSIAVGDKITAKEVTANKFNVISTAEDKSTVNTLIDNTLTVSSHTLVQGDLYVNTTENFDITDPVTRENKKSVINADGSPKNGGGNIYASTFTGRAMAAQYRDLGERFAIDKPAPKGSIVALGGEEEIKLATIQDQVFGVIATAPALRMNEGAGTDETHPYICWCGRIPCRVVGKVKKFDKIYLSETPGVGIARNTGHKKFVGIALENKDTIEEGSVEIVSKIQVI